MAAHIHLRKAGISSPYIQNPVVLNPVFNVSRFGPCAQKRRSCGFAAESQGIHSPFEHGTLSADSSERRTTQAGAGSESFVDVAGLLNEVSALGHDFLFEDDEDEEAIWEHEERLAITAARSASSSANNAPQPPVRGALDPEAVDITSAYSVESGFHQITASQLSERLASGTVALLIDVRSRAEFASGHLKGAQSFPLEDLSAAVRAGLLDNYRSRPVAVVCATGSRSAQATVRLTKVFGYQDVSNVGGGMAACEAEGLTIVT